jgi:general nucleoside transport system permease protein
MSDFFTVSVLVATLASGIRLATPYLLAALGETVGQRSGVLNLGVDGVMLLGAFFAHWTALETGNLWLAVLAGLAAGTVMGGIYALITVYFKAEQGISGIGIFLFGLGFSDLMFEVKVGTPKFTKKLPEVEIPFLSDIPEIGEALFAHSLLTYAAFLMVPAVAWLLHRTTFGMNVRAVGENPQAADSLGVSVGRVRVATILIGNTMAGIAGAALVLEAKVFQPNLTQGLGFIAVALVYFGAWRSPFVMAGALLYGLVQATVIQWKVLGIISRQFSDIAAMAPAVLTVVALIVLAGRVQAPSALTKPFERH